MGIIQAPQSLTGSSGVKPNFKYMVSTDSLGAITTAGYLNNIDLAVYPIQASDILQVIYAYNLQSNSGTYGQFSVSITNGIITLVAVPASGLGTAAAKAASNNALANVASVSGATVAGHYAVFNDVNGTVSDGGATLSSGTTAAYAGGGTSNAFAATGLTASSKVTANISTSTNSVSINKLVPGTNTLTVTFSADPGAATTVTWIALT